MFTCLLILAFIFSWSLAALANATLPQDGAHVSINPPAMRWSSVATGGSFTVQLSQDPAFSAEELLEYDGITMAVFVPDQALAPGTWYWRYQEVAPWGDKYAFTPAKSFVVDLGLPILPVPRGEALLNLVNPEHPRLRVTATQLEAVRKAAQTGRQSLMWKVSVQPSVMDMNENYAKEPGPYPGGGPPNWQDQADVDYAHHISSVTDSAVRLMEKLAYAYLTSGKTAYGERAKGWLLHLAEWDPNGVTSWKYRDYAAMSLLRGMSRAYDWVFPLLTLDERQSVQEVLVVRATQIFAQLKTSHYDSDPYQNHQTRSLAALGDAALALSGDVSEAEEWLQYVLYLFAGIYPPWGGSDGGYSEGLDYWKWYIPLGLEFADHLYTATGINLYEKPWFKNTGYFRLYSQPPGAVYTPFGDGHGSNGFIPADRQILTHLADKLNDPILRWYADQMGANIHSASDPLRTFWWFPDLQAMQGTPPEALPASAYFPDVGWAACNVSLQDPRENVRVLFKSSPYGSQSHGYAEQNTFVIEAFGEPLAISSGYYPFYQSPHHKNWTQQTRSKNGILVNGYGQPYSPNSTGEITAFFASDKVDRVAGDATAAYSEDVSAAYRTLLFVKPNWVLVLDDLKTKTPSRFSWLFHSLQEITPTSVAGFQTSGEKARLDGWILQPDVNIEITDQFQTEGASERVFAGGEIPPENGGADQWHLAATTKEEKSGQKFVTLLHVGKTSDEEVPSPLPMLAKDGSATTLHIPSETGALDGLIGDSSQEWEAGGWATDGSLILSQTRNQPANLQPSLGPSSTWQWLFVADATKLGAVNAPHAWLESESRLQVLWDFGGVDKLWSVEVSAVLPPSRAQLQCAGCKGDPTTATVWLPGRPLKLAQGEKDIQYQWDDAANRATFSFDPIKGAVHIEADSSVSQDSRTIYVSVNGRDENPGTPNAPIQTLAFASEQAQAGDTIVLLPGEYTGTLMPRHSGNSESPITWRAEPRRQAVLVGDNSANYAVSLSGISYHRFDGISVRPTSTTGRWVLLDNVDHVVIDDCLMEEAGGGTPFLIDHGVQVQIVNSSMRNRQGHNMVEVHNSQHILFAGNAFSRAGHALLLIYPDRTNKYITIRGNVFHGAWGRTVLLDSIDYLLFEENIITNSFDGGRSADARYAFYSREGIFRFNTVFGNWGTKGLEVSPYRDTLDYNHVRLYHNIFYENTGIATKIVAHPNVADALYVNNIFAKNDLFGEKRQISLEGGSTDTVRFVNNAISGRLFYSGMLLPVANVQTPVFQRLKGKQFEANLDVVPQFVDGAARDFRLLPTSELVDAGRPLTRTVGEGTGTILPVQDARFFYDSFGIEGEQGDEIVLERSSQTARVVSVEQETNTLVLDHSVSWQENEPVGFGWSGVAPDIGLYENGEVERPAVQVITPSVASPGEAVKMKVVLHGDLQPMQVQWHLGDGNIDTGAQIIHTYDYAYDFPIRVEVVDKSGQIYRGVGYIVVGEKQNGTLLHNTFGSSDADWWWQWQTYRPEPTAWKQVRDGATDGGSLRVYAPQNGALLPARAHPSGWNVDQYSQIVVRYRVYPGTPVGVYLDAFPTSDGERRVWVAGTKAAGSLPKSVESPILLQDDNEWHEMVIDARLVRQLYPEVDVLQTLAFEAPHPELVKEDLDSFMGKGHGYWLDEVTITKAEGDNVSED